MSARFQPPRRWLQDSFDLLLLASAMREEGYLPPTLSLWAVENPMLSPVERLRRKADAGAEVVITQPPLLWERTARWAEEAHRSRVSSNVKVCVLGGGVVCVEQGGGRRGLGWVRRAGGGAPKARPWVCSWVWEGRQVASGAGSCSHVLLRRDVCCCGLCCRQCTLLWQRQPSCHLLQLQPATSPPAAFQPRPPPLLPLPKVVLGLPIVPSAGNLDFWLRLCGVRHMPEAHTLLGTFPQLGGAEGAGGHGRSKEEHAAAVRQWNAQLIKKVRRRACKGRGVTQQMCTSAQPQLPRRCAAVRCLALLLCPTERWLAAWHSAAHRSTGRFAPAIPLRLYGTHPAVALCLQSLNLPGISGLHVMPLTKSARQLTLDFLADGTLPSSLGSAPGAGF